MEQNVAVQIDDTDIVFTCSYCGKSLAIDCQAIGFSVDCPDCGEELTVPEVSEPVPDRQAAAAGVQLTPDQRIESLSNALHASHEDIRRLSAHLTEVSKRRKYLEKIRALNIQRMERFAEELGVIQASIDRVAAMLQDSAREEEPEL